MAKAKKRIFLVDDHPMVREWLKNHIDQQSDVKVCGEADDNAHALSGIDQAVPDLAIVDISLKTGSGLDLIRQLRHQHPGLAIIVLSTHDEAVYAERAFHAGARGYVMKRETTQKILVAIRQVLEGQIYVSEQLAARMAAKVLSPTGNTGGSPLEVLSERELEIFQLLGCGISTPKIASQLHLSLKTIQTYCARIKEKLGLSNGTELLREAIRWNDSQPPSGPLLR